MDGIEKIIARIESEAEAEAEAIVIGARAEAEKIAAEYSEAAQTEYWRLIHEGVAECEARIARRLRAAELEHKKNTLSLKRALVDEAFALAEKTLLSLPERQYAALLTALCVIAARGGEERVIMNPRDRAKQYALSAVRAANAELPQKRGLPGRLTLSDETRSIAGGLILSDGDAEVNCAVEALCELYRAELEPQAAEVLFE